MPSRDPEFRELGQYFSLAAIGLEMVIPIVVGVYLDRTFDWSPWGALIGVVCGFVAGIFHALTVVKKHGDRKSSKSDEGT